MLKSEREGNIMQFYYCPHCKEIIDDEDIIGGYTANVDAYENNRCACGDESIFEITYDDICICGEYLEDIDENGDRYCKYCSPKAIEKITA
jgi:DNA-directed RNA polymerase subunit RPC12/RpoP